MEYSELVGAYILTLGIALGTEIIFRHFYSDMNSLCRDWQNDT